MASTPCRMVLKVSGCVLFVLIFIKLGTQLYTLSCKQTHRMYYAVKRHASHLVVQMSSSVTNINPFREGEKCCIKQMKTYVEVNHVQKGTRYRRQNLLLTARMSLAYTGDASHIGPTRQIFMSCGRQCGTTNEVFACEVMQIRQLFQSCVDTSAC